MRIKPQKYGHLKTPEEIHVPNIKVLRHADAPPTDDELHAAALQFVRKISGYGKPSQANEAVFYQTVNDIAACSRKLFDGLVGGPELMICTEEQNRRRKFSSQNLRPSNSAPSALQA